MPHCIVEYAASLRGSVDWHDVLGALHRVLLESGQFAAADIRCRAIAYEDFSLGDGQAFVALTIKMLDGRSDEIKAAIADATLGALKELFAATRAPRPLNVTVAIEDIHRASYRRHTG